MEDKYGEFKVAFSDYFKSLNHLKELGVVPNKKDFTSQLGEWLVETIYEGKRAESGIQKYWDVKVAAELIQVKTHAKAKTNSARWSSIKLDEDAELTKVIIIVFSEDYKLLEYYEIPWEKCIELIKPNSSGDVLYWDHLFEFKIKLENLPNQEIISMFK